jgi:thiamine-monophosphate kinase
MTRRSCRPQAATAPLVVNTDLLVDGLHFSDATMGPEDVGWRAAAANLSDLAAMGCPARGGDNGGAGGPGRRPGAWVEGVYAGLSSALAHHGGQLLGGDCSGGDQRMLAITALGEVRRRGDPPRRRPRWRLAGEHGLHGLSRLGLALLLRELPAPPAAGLGEVAAAGHRGPPPPPPRWMRCRLAECQPPGSPWRVGGTDSSDGLGAAVAQLAGGAGCVAELNRNALPMPPDLAHLAQGEGWCLGGGEDFELVLALEPAWGRPWWRRCRVASGLEDLVAPGAGDAAEAGSLRWQASG